MVELVLRAQLTLVLTRELAMNRDDATSLVGDLPWTRLRAHLDTEGVFACSPKQMTVAILKASTPCITPEIRVRFERVLEARLMKDVDRLCDKWKIPRHANKQIQANVLPPLMNDITGNASQLVELIANPMSVPPLLLQKLGKICEELGEELQEILVDIILECLIDHGVDEGDAKTLMLTFPRIFHVNSLSNPIDASRLLLKKIASQSKDENGELLERCARAVVAHWLAEEVQRRGFDDRMTWLVRETIDALTVETLIDATRDPDKLTRVVLQEARESGAEFARAALDDAVERARDKAMAELRSTGMSEEMADELVDVAQENLLNPENAVALIKEAKNVSADELINGIEARMKDATAASGLAAAAFFLRGRCLPLYDMVSDLLVILEMHEDKYRGCTAFFGLPFDWCFLYPAVAFFLQTWVVLWIALGQHAAMVLFEMAVELEKKIKIRRVPLLCLSVGMIMLFAPLGSITPATLRRLLRRLSRFSPFRHFSSLACLYCFSSKCRGLSPRECYMLAQSCGADFIPSS